MALVKMRTILTALALAGLATAASAFPTWMGVYGQFERHSEGNPGTYTVLMNQDYYGLEAEVGVQVDGGSWTVYAMDYVGNVDGNSQWAFTPGSTYPVDSTVIFYFHGFDNYGGNIWDSNGGSNYSFTVEAPVVEDLAWLSPIDVPASESNSTTSTAVSNGTIYAVWMDPTNQMGGPSSIKFAKKAPGQAWTSEVEISDLSYQYNTSPEIAVYGNTVHVLYNGQYTKYLRSTDGGATWNAPIALPVVHAGTATGAMMAATANKLYVAYNDYSVPEVSRYNLTSIGSSDTAFATPVMFHTVTSGKTSGAIDDLIVRGDKIFISSRLTSWYAGYYINYYHESLDGGQTFTQDDIVGKQLELTADPNGDTVYAAYVEAGLYSQPGMYFATRTPGGSWTGMTKVWDDVVFVDGLQLTPSGLRAIGKLGSGEFLRTSTDGGATWGDPQAGPEYFSFSEDNVDGEDIYLTGYNGGYYYVAPLRADLDPTNVVWAGNAYNWPANGDLDGGENLWVNVESYPAGNAVTVRVVYTIDGGQTWLSRVMTYADQIGNNDWWHLNLWTFPSGTTIEYAIEVIGGDGESIWVNNGGNNYSVTVN